MIVELGDFLLGEVRNAGHMWKNKQGRKKGLSCVIMCRKNGPFEPAIATIFYAHIAVLSTRLVALVDRKVPRQLPAAHLALVHAVLDQVQHVHELTHNGRRGE